MRRLASSAVAVLALAALAGCGGEEEPPAAAVPLDTIEKGDLCDRLTAGLLEELTGEEFGRPQVSEDRPGRVDGCSSGSADSGIAVTVEVWAEQRELAEDLLKLGSPASSSEATESTIAGNDALSAVAEKEDRQLADLAVHADGRTLVVLMQQEDAYVGEATLDDQLDTATTIAERLLPA
ncbi:hypothetical protein [Nocardioides hwasunensis]|uniref:DUF3558 domain-containing protein n=1 Tax=Nocardioides hwasunensis TaxID=397258 RepID=A0ABR8MNQ3_9ACTN|nr:hypothetical protein [Nocardioides hwasunensis]MBD3916921.1 hypothetical protein [Nocardioides hwasunensis]